MKGITGSQLTEEFKSSSAFTLGVFPESLNLSTSGMNQRGLLTVTTGLKAKNTSGGRGIPKLCGLLRGLTS